MNSFPFVWYITVPWSYWYFRRYSMGDGGANKRWGISRPLLPQVLFRRFDDTHVLIHIKFLATRQQVSRILRYHTYKSLFEVHLNQEEGVKVEQSEFQRWPIFVDYDWCSPLIQSTPLQIMITSRFLFRLSPDNIGLTLHLTSIELYVDTPSFLSKGKNWEKKRDIIIIEEYRTLCKIHYVTKSMSHFSEKSCGWRSWWIEPRWCGR